MAKATPVIVFGKEYKSRAVACKAFGHAPSKIDHRMRKGLSLEEAISDTDRYQGKKSHPLYSHWNGMRSRCYSKSACSSGYKKKEIVMCDAWKNDFWAFVEDMGLPPAEEMSIDRIDNSGNYSPENCRWATRSQQQRNMSSNIPITIFNETKLLVEWAEISTLNANTIRKRVLGGMPPELAVTQPTREGNTSMIMIGTNRLIYNKIQEEAKDATFAGAALNRKETK